MIVFFLHEISNGLKVEEITPISLSAMIRFVWENALKNHIRIYHSRLWSSGVAQFVWKCRMMSLLYRHSNRCTVSLTCGSEDLCSSFEFHLMILPSTCIMHSSIHCGRGINLFHFIHSDGFPLQIPSEAADSRSEGKWIRKGGKKLHSKQ